MTGAGVNECNRDLSPTETMNYQLEGRMTSGLTTAYPGRPGGLVKPRVGYHPDRSREDSGFFEGRLLAANAIYRIGQVAGAVNTSIRRGAPLATS